MDFSLFLMGTRGSEYADILDQVIEADHLGFRGVWLAERSFANGDLLWPSPMVAAAYMAAKTRRIRIGLAARILPFHHPMHVAADAATLDIVSQGRLDLGLSGSSMDEVQHRVFGVPRDEARGRFEEGIEILRRALRGERLSFKGRHFTVEDVSLTPRPRQCPHPPIYLIANSPAAIDWAAELGLSIFVHGAHDAEGVRGCVARYRAASRRAGMEPGDMDLPINRFVYVGESDREARAVMRESFMEFLRARAPDLRGFLEKRFGDAAKSFDFLADEIGVFGDAERCIARLRALREGAGARHVLCTFNLITLDHEACVASMRRFAEDVMPAFEWEPRSIRAQAGAPMMAI